MKKNLSLFFFLLALCAALFSGCAPSEEAPVGSSALDPSLVPEYNCEVYSVINENIPFFTESEKTTETFEHYSALDSLGRCGVAFANVCPALMPTEVRGSIGQLKPSGWQTIRYDDLISDHYLYNRCHLIAFMLAGENANEQNLITGTRCLNVSGMLPFETEVADYVEETGNHVLYRVTPVFAGTDLVASGVLMEAFSVEDEGEGVTFCVYCYNIQPGIVIDYATGESARSQTALAEAPEGESAYIGNVNSHVFHAPDCTSLPKEENRIFFGSREQAVDAGYSPCGRCKP